MTHSDNACPLCGGAELEEYTARISSGARHHRYGCHECCVYTETYHHARVPTHLWSEMCRRVRCRHCGLWPYQHVRGKCLFSSTSYHAVDPEVVHRWRPNEEASWFRTYQLQLLEETQRDACDAI